MQRLLIRLFIARIAIALSVLFMSGTLVTALPVRIADEQEQGEHEGTECEALLEFTKEALPAAKHRAAAREVEEPASTAELFAVHRKWPPAPPKARGPDALSAPIPHLLN